MDSDEGERRKGRRRLAVAGMGALAAALIAGLWSQRGPIATHFIDRALAEKGVRARFRITRFGTASQRLEDVVIGDPAHPDLVAKWAELRMSLGLNGTELHGITAGGVRLRGRIVDGRLSLGEIDKLLPPPSGAPFSLPDIELGLRDARMLLATPLGPIGLALDGRGRLTDGFSGRLTATAPSLARGACGARDASARLSIAIQAGRPEFAGPIRAAGLDCGGIGLADARLALSAEASPTLDRWTGTAALAADRARTATARAGATRATLAFDLADGRSRGPVTLALADVRAGGTTMRSATFDGHYAVGPGGDAQAAGSGKADRLAIMPQGRRRLAAMLASVGAGSPAGPLLAAFGSALDRAGRDVSARARLGIADGGGGTRVALASLDARSASGAHLAFAGETPLTLTRLAAPLLPPGTASIGGGGLPAMQLAFRRTRHGLAGTLDLAAFATGGAGIAPLHVTFASDARGTTLAARPVLDGPFGSGRVEGLTLPLDIRMAAGGTILLNPHCAELAFSKLAIAGIGLADARLPLCPTGAALLVRAPNGTLTGGGDILGPRLNGRIGTQPLAIAAAALRIPFDRSGFSGDRVTIRLGEGGDPTRLDLAALAGTFLAGGIEGDYTGADGKIAAVPLLVRDGAGRWRLIDGRLALDGRVEVADADAAAPRFKPLRADDLRLTLIDSRIRATAMLREPVTGARISDVVIGHDLRDGHGDAVLAVPGIAFTKALQPEALTPLALGLVADVRGTLGGEGRIRWDARGTASDGVFRTAAMDLSAPFGPVTGLATTIRFDDLLGLHSAAAQIATLKSVNPGIAVDDGVVRYQLLGGQRVAIEGARWPFAGGELTLAATTLDFAQDAERRLTFRVTGMDAARFVEQFGFDNIAVTGTFDGVVPMVFGRNGGRIEGGHLSVRPGGGTLAYVGEISNARLGTYGKLAFDALKSMRYSNLAIALDGSLDGEVVSQVLFDGTNRTPKEATSRFGLLRQFANLPFRFRINIRAPFRRLIDSAESLDDPRGLIARSLGHGAGVVQP